MKEYKVVTQKYGQKIDKKLAKISGSKIKHLDYTSYRWECANEKEKEEILPKIVQILGDLVQACVIKKVCSNYMKELSDLTKVDKKKIEASFITNNFMAREEGVSYISYYLIYVPLLHMLEEEERINIDGWIYFRTQRYRVILRDLLEEAVYQYRVQKEYLECIHLLVESREELCCEERLEVIHIIFNKDGQLKLCDGEMRDQTEEYKVAYCSELKGVDSSLEDLLLNLLIHASPKVICIHKREYMPNAYFLDTLERVFEREIHYCKGCPYCQIKEES